MPAIAYSYLRMSSAAQIKGDSLRRQLERSRTYAQKHGLQLDESLRDLGVSAFRGKNHQEGALGRFLELVRDGRIASGSILIVESLDRISRQTPLEALEPFLALIRAGIKVVTLADEQCYDRERLVKEPWGLMVSLMIMMRAHDESQMKSQRCGAIWAQKQQNATSKKVTKRCPSWLRLSDDRTHFIVVPEMANVVRQIFEWTANGMGRFAVTKMLNQNGVPSLGGPRWNASSIARLLKDPAVAGIYTPHTVKGGKRTATGERIAGYYPAIVTPDLVSRAHAEMASRAVERSGGRRDGGYNNLFHGLVFCACGEPMRMRNAGTMRRNKGRRLVCSASVEGIACPHRRYFNLAKFEERFLRIVADLDFDRLDTSTNKRASEMAIQIAECDMAIADLQRKTKRLAEIIADAEVPQAILAEIRRTETMIAEEQDRLAQLQRERNQMRIESETDHIAEMSKYTAKMRNQSGDELYRTRAALSAEIKRVVQRITFDGQAGRIFIVMRERWRVYIVLSWDGLALVVDGEPDRLMVNAA